MLYVRECGKLTGILKNRKFVTISRLKFIFSFADLEQPAASHYMKVSCRLNKAKNTTFSGL